MDLNGKTTKVLERINCLLSFDTTLTAYKTTPPVILHCWRNMFNELLPGGGNHTDWPTNSPLIWHGPQRKCVNNSCIAACIHCCDMFTKPLPSNDREDTHTDTQTGGRGLCSTPLRWIQVTDIHNKFHEDWFRHSKIQGWEHTWCYNFYIMHPLCLNLIINNCTSTQQYLFANYIQFGVHICGY
jgi:hypothetical protein